MDFKTVVTIVGDYLDSSTLNYSMKLIKDLGVSDMKYDILKDDYAIDIFVSEYSDELVANIRERLPRIGKYDIFVQKNDRKRKKKLLVADMESTILRQEMLDEVAAEFGIKKEIAEITKRGMLGEISFEESVHERLALLNGRPVAEFEKMKAIMTYNKGAAELVKYMSSYGGKAILVSGGFDIFTSKAAHDLGFYRSFANSLVVRDGILTGEYIPPLLDRAMKAEILLEEAKKLDLKPSEVIAVGDGANDLDMLHLAGMGVGYYAKPAVQDEIPNQIKYTDFMTLLYLQGYKYSELSRVLF